MEKENYLKNTSEIMVSICCICYNQHSFLPETLKGFNSQEIDFIIEVIIYDDCSTDGSREILKSFKESCKYPVTLILSEENRYSKGDRIFPKTFKQAKGKYIALCEGDDYWTDPYKLQKQVDFLEANPDYSLCFHKVKILDKENGLVDDFITENRYEKIKKFPITQDSLYKYSNFIHTPSVVFKNVVKKFPMELYLSPVGDYLLYFLLSKHGYLHRINECMAVYRYGHGIYSSASVKKKKIIGKQFQICLLSFIDSEYIKKDIIQKTLNNIRYTENKNIDNLTTTDLTREIYKRIWLKTKKNFKKLL
ncbi:MAG: glycosyl transferase [Flavobacteriaceae bacterium]|mgnify:CR=1 FL=1|nr:glycosyl transferase [Flavobacteriaceae bacterium]|tara:strand:+ start:248 stop:1168 length:921 start_codon:yes stop_codon:yes gene_type:complete